MESNLAVKGRLAAKLINAQKAPLAWRISNTLRPAYLIGWLVNWLAVIFTKVTKIKTITARLEARLIKADGAVINYGTLSYRYVTNAGVGFIVDDWDDSTTDITTLNFHASGTDNTAENVSDTALGTEATTVTDRVAGTKSQPSANQLQSVGTQSFTGSAAIVEHGILSVITEGSGVLWDRSVFSTINVGNGDSIQWTYTATINSGG